MPNPKSWFGRGNTRALLISGSVLALAITGSAFAVGEGDPLEGGERNPNANQTQQLEDETEIIGDIAATGAQKGGYVTRQSNTRTGADAGGAAIYGCRSTGVNTDTDESCLRANNLADGLAFSFDSNGTLGGIITVGDGGREEKPFTTNATGVATGLNADEVDGLDAEEIAGGIAGATDRWALVGEDGTIIRQSGGFEIVNCFEDNTNCYIDTNEADASNNGLSGTIAVQNNVEGVDPSLTGQIAVGACSSAQVNCAPDSTEGAGNEGVIVVAPRNDAGEDPGATAGKRFYVHVSAAEAAAAPTPAG